MLCSLTEGEAKHVLKGMVGTGLIHNGFKAMLIFSRRFDSKTSASLLQSYLEVLRPGSIKGVMEIVSGIHQWGAKVSALKSRCEEDLGDNLTLAILVGMLPMDYQDHYGFAKLHSDV